MKTAIENKLARNLSRVGNLISIYEKLAGAGQGRRGHHQTDVLRAATVLLHATLEDFIRSIAYWKLPNAGPDVLKALPFVNHGPTGTKFGLGDMARLYRNQSVENVIKNSVEAHLERSNYNNASDLSQALRDFGIDPASCNDNFATLEALMARRHQIVHRADQDGTGGQGNHKVKSIGLKHVRIWAEAVHEFALTVLGQL